MAGFVNFLHFISKSPEKRIIQILTRNKRVVKAICEILLNILLKNIKVDRRIAHKLEKHKHIIYELVDKHTSLHQRRRLLLKAWPIVRILTPILPLISKAIKNEPIFKNVFNN
jgi:hypothetical protein